MELLSQTQHIPGTKVVVHWLWLGVVHSSPARPSTRRHVSALYFYVTPFPISARWTNHTTYQGVKDLENGPQPTRGRETLSVSLHLRRRSTSQQALAGKWTVASAKPAPSPV